MIAPQLIARARTTADAILTHKALDGCPYPSGDMARAYALGVAAAQLKTLADELERALAELERLEVAA